MLVEAISHPCISIQFQHWDWMRKAGRVIFLYGSGGQSAALLGNELTVSRAPLDSIRSVVAATLPPFLCRSHMISLRGICGNICDICSTSAGFAVRELPRPDADNEDVGVKKKYLTARADRAARRRREGIERVCC